MSYTFDATAGGAASTSYVDVATADAYLALSPYGSAAWAASSQAEKEQALIEATRRLDVLSWAGDLATGTQGTQRLQWPRAWVRDPRRGLPLDPALWPGVPYSGDLTQYLDATTIPHWIADATCELALEVLKSGTTDPWSADAQGNVRREVVGPLTTEYFEPGRSARGVGSFPRVMQGIAPFLVSGTRVVRG